MGTSYTTDEHHCVGLRHYLTWIRIIRRHPASDHVALKIRCMSSFPVWRLGISQAR